MRKYYKTLREIKLNLSFSWYENQLSTQILSEIHFCLSKQKHDLTSADSHWKENLGKTNTKGHPASRYFKNTPKNYVGFKEIRNWLSL